MGNPIKISEAAISIPTDFEFGAVEASPKRAPAASPPPPTLGPLAAFVGTWKGSGFNTIFRPDNAKTPTVLPNPAPPVGDNVLELNLTAETLTFSPSLGSVPNRGSNPQGDIFLNGVPYLQAINDVTTPGQVVGIHLEPGLWMFVPSTTAPVEGDTVVRMASIPHGTTIEAQGTFKTGNAAPNIPSVSITPFVTANGGIPINPPTVPPAGAILFPSQTAANPATRRIPQDLSSFISNGTITQAMLDDPNSLLRDHISHQHILSHTEISISTQPKSPPPIAGLPQIGGGVDNIAFLQGDGTVPVPTSPNAQVLQMTATFYIETVRVVLTVPVPHAGQTTLLITPDTTFPGQHAPTFSVTPPVELTKPRTIKVKFTQIQYTQLVLLNFAGLTWPHVSVATLVPAHAIVVPASAFA